MSKRREQTEAQANQEIFRKKKISSDKGKKTCFLSIILFAIQESYNFSTYSNRKNPILS